MFFPSNLVLRGHNDSIGQLSLPLVQQGLPRGGNLVWVQAVELLHPDRQVKVVFCLNSQLHNNDWCPTILIYCFCNMGDKWIRSFTFFFCAQPVLLQPQLSSCQEENDHFRAMTLFFPSNSERGYFSSSYNRCKISWVSTCLGSQEQRRHSWFLVGRTPPQPHWSE